METAKPKSFTRGWSMVVAWFIVWAILNFVTSQTLSVYRTAVAELRGFDTSFLLTFHSTASIFMTFVVLILPKYISKFGAKTIMVFGLIAAGITYIVSPFMTNQVVFAICMSLQVLWGLIYASIGSLIMVSKWFPRKKGSIMGIITGASILSAGVMLPIFSAINAKNGIISAMVVFGIVVIAFGVICIFWLKETPEECGLMPDNKPMSDEERTRLAAGKHVKSDWSYRQLLKTKAIWFIGIGWGTGLMGVGVLSTVAFNYLLGLGLDYTQAISILTVGGFITVVGSWGSGFIDQRIGPRKTGVVVMLLLIISLFISGIWTAAPVWVGVTCLLVVWCMAGATNNLGASQLLGIYGPKSFASVTVLFTIINNIRNFCGIIDGQSLKLTGGYTAGFLLVGALMVVGAILIACAGEKFLPPPTENVATEAAKAK